MNDTDLAVFVHERALCESAEVGAGTRIWAFAHVMQGAKIGSECNIGDHAFIEKGAVIGDRVTVKNAVLVWDGVIVEDEVFLGPNMIFTNVAAPRARFKTDPSHFGETLVKKGTTIGANATIVCGVTLNSYAFVGAGAVVIRSVPAHAMVVGNPARQIGWACACGSKLPASLACACGRSYRLVDPAFGLMPISPAADI